MLDLTAAAADSVSWGVFTWSGDFTMLDLIAATTNALNGALLARRPDHYKNFTVVGILLMALIGGMTGGVIRDLILMDVPSAFTNPAYIVLCLVAGVIGYFIAYTKGEMFREGLFQFVCSFSLPWFAIVGASAAISAGLPISGALVLAAQMSRTRTRCVGAYPSAVRSTVTPPVSALSLRLSAASAMSPPARRFT